MTRNLTDEEIRLIPDNVQEARIRLLKATIPADQRELSRHLRERRRRERAHKRRLAREAIALLAAEAQGATCA
ncbi:hypothetical protein [Lysobacter enzymogenes]|uniref:hypothetical protein n=1 Tax=Lysobacter enzymogenes TaxID=69 RepID=UPI00089A7B4C|nr:hypothetical protein [Lysobacter enzymogenes]SDX52162.1 hypothetical protein SAMN05421681_1067 [Lysobacter enzymogenes]